MEEPKRTLWEILLPFGVQMGHELDIPTISNFKHTASPLIITAPTPPNQMTHYLFLWEMGHNPHYPPAAHPLINTINLINPMHVKTYSTENTRFGVVYNSVTYSEA